jgi:hypothetical protein
LLALAAVLVAQSAHAHGIAGNRLFPGTLAFDDPAVADEFSIQTTAKPKQPDNGNARDIASNWSFIRLLMPDLAAGISSGYIRRSRDGYRSQAGFDETFLTLKGQLYKNEPHETLIAARLTWGIGGSAKVWRPSRQPGWLRPFAITGAASIEAPLGRTATNLAVDPDTGVLGPMTTIQVPTVHWGFSVEFSTYYLTSRFTGGPPKEEP